MDGTVRNSVGDLKYAQHVADRFDPVDTVNVPAKALRFDEQSDFWTVITDAGAQISARHRIMATGRRSSPREPNIPGVGLFAGARYHDRPEGGRRMALISPVCELVSSAPDQRGIQIIPQFARDAKHLHVFQMNWRTIASRLRIVC